MSKSGLQLDNVLDFQEMLSHVATLYRRSLSVPFILVSFIGSGMSLPSCTALKPVNVTAEPAKEI